MYIIQMNLSGCPLCFINEDTKDHGQCFAKNMQDSFCSLLLHFYIHANYTVYKGVPRMFTKQTLTILL